MRVGVGYDLHRLVKGRSLVLGGVVIPFEKGLLGHSDADVLLHAACDAMLGAAAMGDIGRHFPDTDSKFKGISSKVFVEKTYELILEKGLSVNNLDATIIAEAPKLLPYCKTMKENISSLLEVEPGSVNIKATTNEGIGGIGRGEAIAAICVVSLVSHR
jgi:2-C-methyl-D-erythritol 2,4-cyclodiphosphate synthase